MTMFVDTSGWIALFDKSDKYFVTATDHWQQMKNEPLNLRTADYVLVETLTHLLYRCGREVALRFGNWAFSATYLQVLFIDKTV